MGSNNIIIREYLESLKEDEELDYLFPILLNIMGFRIITTARESKGQPQYGKDIVAIGIDEDGIEKKFCFEIKGHSDRDIDDTNLNKKDGIIDSLKASRYTPFKDSAIPSFNSMPVKYVLVHNGMLKSNTRATFNGFIDETFKPGEFERWGIYELTDLFSKYLFGEYLFTDEQSLRLLKKTLALLDAPENDFRDFELLIDLQIDKIGAVKKGRAFIKFFATQNLLASLILHYSNENGNIEPAKYCLTYLLLKTWSWILKGNLEKKPFIKREFGKLVNIHFKMLTMYFNNTLSTAIKENGLFAENGGPFEEVGYPLRSFEYLNYLIYYFQARLYFPTFSKTPSETKKRILKRKQKDLLIELIHNNDGCCRPLMDYHSIAIMNVFIFLLDEKEIQDKDLVFMGEYLFDIIENISMIYFTRKRFPLLGDNELPLIKTAAKNEKYSYEDRSTLLITMLFELAAIINYDYIHKNYKTLFDGKLNLQTAYPNIGEFDIEQLLFEKHFDREFHVETNINLKSNLQEFKEIMAKKVYKKIEYRTDKAGFPFLRILAHVFFKNEFFVDEWRKYYEISE